jgi:cytochrome c553
MKRITINYAALFSLLGPALIFGGGSLVGRGLADVGRQGAEIFYADCSGCHPQGGNTINPNLPLHGAPQLESFESFLAYIRHPTLPNGARGAMPAFSSARISDKQARELYRFLAASEKTAPQGPGYGQGSSGGYGGGGRSGGPGYGYGMGPGMMGGGMMGRGYGGYGGSPGMMGRGYGYGYGPQYGQREKPLDKEEAKEEVENYLQSTRNPNLKLGKIEDKGNVFEADIVTKESNSLVDKILVDKDTGTMRSAY